LTPLFGTNLTDAVRWFSWSRKQEKHHRSAPRGSVLDVPRTPNPGSYAIAKLCDACMVGYGGHDQSTTQRPATWRAAQGGRQLET